MFDEIIQYTLKQMDRAGFDRSHCTLTQDSRQELNVENDQISLLRSGRDQELFIAGIRNHCKASISISNLDQQSIDDAIEELQEMADSSEPDKAWDIAPVQPAEQFIAGPQSADLDRMYDRLEEFLAYVAAKYPNIVMAECSLDYTRVNTRLVNSNGVDFTEIRGEYNGSMLFNARDEENTSSFSFTGFSSFDLDNPIYQYSTIEQQLKNSSDSLKAHPIPGKFKGEIIITPDAIDDFLSFLTGSVRDGSLIAGTSLYLGKLGQQVASSSSYPEECASG